MRPTSFRFGGIAFLFVALVLSPWLTAADSVTSNKLLDIPVRLISQSYEGNELTVITADLGRPGIQHSSLTLTINSDGFNREVQIEGSDDNQTWIKLESTIENNTINYPTVTFRYLRVTIYDRGEKRLIIAGALAHRSPSLVATSTLQVSSTTLGAPFYERPVYLLVGGLILVIGVIGGFAFRLFKQTRV